jgi:protein-disulfide isomerase
VHLNRRDTIVLLSAAASALALTGGAHAAEGDTHDVAKLMASAETNAVPDHPIGSDTAPVTVIEYASPTCPHCAAFSNNVLPAFKTAYIDTGKVKLIIRPFLRNVLDAVVFMLADAGGAENYHNILETFFRTQTKWAVAEKPRDALLEVAKQLGFTDASFDAALTNQALYNGMEAMKTEALETFDLEGTPTFYVNGKQLTGDKTLVQLAEVIDPLIPADFKPTAPAEASTTPAADPAPADSNAMAAEPVAPAAEPNAMAAEPATPAAPAQ